MAVVNVLVLPGSDYHLQVFLSEGGPWRDMSTNAEMKLSEIQMEVDNKLNDIMRRFDRGNVFMDLKKLGFTWLCRKLGLEPLMKELCAIANCHPGDEMVLHIYSRVDWIPWELIYPLCLNDFLGVRFQIARIPILRKYPEGTRDRRITTIYNVLGRRVLLASNMTQWAGTFSSGRRVIPHERSFPSAAGGWNNYPTVSDLELRGMDPVPDIIHITCHGGIDDTKGGVYWTLDDQIDDPGRHRIEYDSLEFVSGLLRLESSRPLVFGNACASNIGPSTSMLGFGGKLISLGAAAFIGTFAPVTHQLAVDFAIEFYKRLLGLGMKAMPIGEALWKTKQHYDAKGGNDPSWLFYCLYGPPDMCFHLQT